jgi:hypothetical protein
MLVRIGAQARPENIAPGTPQMPPDSTILAVLLYLVTRFRSIWLISAINVVWLDTDS